MAKQGYTPLKGGGQDDSRVALLPTNSPRDVRRGDGEPSNAGVEKQVSELLKCKDADVKQIWERMLKAKPGLREGLLELFDEERVNVPRRNSSRSRITQSGTATGTGTRRARTSHIYQDSEEDCEEQVHSPVAAKTREGHKNIPIVQFSSAMAFGAEGESAFVPLEVIRIGDCSKVTKVRYQTCDVTAKAGEIYEASSDEIVFQPNEETKTIQVHLINNAQWNTLTEFKVELLSEGMENALLGRFLWQTRVKVIDDDTFPSNYYAEEVNKFPHGPLTAPGILEGVERFKLLREYFKLNMHQPAIHWKVMMHFVGGTVLNLMFALKVISNIYLVDFVLDAETRPEYLEKYTTICLLCYTGLTIFEVALRHCLDYYLSSTCAIGGTCRSQLQAGLLRKFLNFDNESRENFPQSDLVMAMIRDINALVDSFGNAIEIVNALGMCAIIFMLQLLKPMIHSNPPSLYSPLVTIVFPALLIPFFYCRNEKSMEVLQESAKKQNEVIDHIEYTVDVFRLVADYSKRAVFVSRFEQCITAFNAAGKNSRLTLLNNRYFAPWIVALATASYMVFGGICVINSTATLGSFLANLSVLAKIGEAWSGIYSHVLDLQGVFPSLDRVVIFMNLRTDMKQRKEIAEFSCKQTCEERKTYLSTPKTPFVDLLPIKFMCGQGVGDCMPKGEVNWVGNISIAQGKLVALVGPRGGGKSTVLRMLGGAQLPWSDSNVRCYIPTHLRVLHVSSEPLLIQGTLLDNLRFGVQKDDPDGDVDRVMKICKRLHMPANMLNLMTDPNVPWHSRLSQTEQRQINIARALIANYHVICIHRPTMGFSDKGEENILTLMEEFVRNKGVVQDPDAIESRRPRTCILTTSKILDWKRFDEVYVVKHNAIKQFDANDIEDVG